MTKKLIYLVLVILVVAACTKEKETPSGMKYKVHREGNGTLATTGQFVIFNFQLKDNNDSIWSSTWNEGIPAYQPIADSANIPNEDGMHQMIRALSVGDSVSVTMSTKDFFRDLVHSAVPRYIDSTGSLTYIISATDIKSQQEYFTDRSALVARRDSTAINEYLQKNNIQAERDSSGLYYVVYNREGGPKPTAASCVEARYVGKLLRNGQIFDGAESAAFPLTQVISGWTIGMPLLGKGDSATFYIPSGLGYGREGYPGVIPPDAVLEFKVTLLDVKTEFDPTTRTCK